MAVDAASLALGLLALSGFVGLDAATQRGWISPRAEIRWLAGLVAVALCAHLGIVRSDSRGLTLSTPPPHLHEFFHYYLGTKYFAELGHSGLYTATIHADREAAPEAFRPQARMRDLTTNAPIRRGDALEAGRSVRERFSEARWAEFGRDLRVIRDANPRELWHTRGYLQDHGYNGTPLVTWIFGALGQGGGEATSFINFMRWVDPYLLILLGGIVGLTLSARAGLVFLFVLFANPLYDYIYVGGSYLRSLDLLTLGGAWLALRTDARKSAGALLGCATLLRIFPVLFLGGLVGQALLQRDRSTRLRAQLPLLAAFGATVCTLGVASELAIETPSGDSAWRAFAQNLSLHAATPTTNDVGWPTLVAYAPEKDLHPGLEGRAQAKPPPRDFDWVRETQRVLDARSGYRWAGTIALLGMAALCLRRSRETGSFLPVMLSLFAITAPSHYYWSLLAIVPLATERRDVRLGLILTFAVFAALFWPGVLDTQLDLRFALVSGVLGLFLIWACIRSWRAGRAAALGTLVGIAALGCAPEVPEEQKGPRIDGDTFRSETLGFGFDKPSDWHFLPGSSLVGEAPTRVKDRAELWERLHKPALTPLVKLASTPEAVTGRDEVAILHVIPIRPGESDIAVELLMKTPLPGILRSFAHARAGGNPGFRVVSEPVAIDFERVKGARMDLRYDSDGRPAHERITVFRRVDLYWYVRLIAPEPIDARSEARFDRFVSSLRFDP